MVAGMNLEQLKKDIGYRVKLVPPAYHLDAAGEPIPFQDEDWIIMAVTNEYVEINTAPGHFYRLGKDHVRSFTTDSHRAADGLNHAFLQLHVQLYIRGTDVTAIPNHQPGAPVPPPLNPALKARATFVPELERVFRRQVQILDRVVVNFSVTANDMLGTHQAIRPGDTWESLRPVQPRLFPQVAVYRDLSASDAELLAEFYGVVSEVADLIEHWGGTMALTEYNAWNVLMHKVQNSLRMGELAVQKLCHDRAYDATMPAGGSLLSQCQRVLTAADKAREIFMAKFATLQQRKAVRS
jgi:hypothetical protein